MACNRRATAACQHALNSKVNGLSKLVRCSRQKGAYCQLVFDGEGEESKLKQLMITSQRAFREAGNPFSIPQLTGGTVYWSTMYLE